MSMNDVALIFITAEFSCVCCFFTMLFAGFVCGVKSAWYRAFLVATFAFLGVMATLVILMVIGWLN